MIRIYNLKNYEVKKKKDGEFNCDYYENKIENIFVSQEIKKSLQVFDSEIFFYINLKEAGNYNINFLINDCISICIDYSPADANKFVYGIKLIPVFLV